MWPRSADARADAFGRYWDALAGGAPADETARLREGVDPTLIAATERVRADHRPRQADPAFVARLERDLMQTLDAAYAGSRPLLPGQTRPSAGAGRLSPVRATATGHRARRIPARAGYAAAALLVAAALALAIRPWEGGQRAALPPALPAPTAAATPAATPAPGAIELRATATGLPDGPSWVGIARDTFAPGTDITFDCRGADLLIAESGTLLVTTDRPARVTRAGGSAAEVPASTEVTLAAGDGIAVEGPTALRLRNPGSVPAVAIESGIEVDNGTAEGGYNYEILAAQENAALRYPAAIGLRRVTLAPGETLSAPPAGALQLAAAASPDGLLASTDDGERNIGRAPLAVYVYTIAFPAASPVATPAQAEAQLLALTLPAWEGPAWVLVEVTVPANVATVTDGGTCCQGALVDYVLAGRERLRSDGPLRVARAGNPGAWEDLPAGSEVTLGPGDAAMRRGELPWRVANDGAELRLLQLVAASSPPGPVGWDWGGYAWAQPSPAGQAGALTLTLIRVALVPGGTVPAPGAGAAQAVIAPAPDGPVGQLSDGAAAYYGTTPATGYALQIRPAPGAATPVD